MANKLSSLRLLESFIEDLETAIEESLITYPEPVIDCSNTPQEIKSLSTKILAHLTKDDDGVSYDELITKYNSLISAYQDLKPYCNPIKTSSVSNIPQDISGKKSVRFNDKVHIKSFSPFSDTLPSSSSTSNSSVANQGTPLLFEHSEDPDSENENLLSNSDIFASHQQTQLSQQDSHLKSLSESVQRSHMLSLDIHDELNQHNIILTDLEAQLDHNEVNLQRAQRGLEKFNVLVKENREWFTIFCLFVILIMLLIVF